MTRAMEMHDSVVSSVLSEKENVILTFDTAYIHEWSDIQSSSGTGWAQIVVIKISNCKFSGSLPTTPCKLSDGSLLCDGQTIDNVVVLPFQAAGKVQLTLQFVTGDTALFVGTGITLNVEGEAEFIEDVPPDAIKEHA